MKSLFIACLVTLSVLSPSGYSQQPVYLSSAASIQQQIDQLEAQKKANDDAYNEQIKQLAEANRVRLENYYAATRGLPYDQTRSLSAENTRASTEYSNALSAISRSKSNNYSTYSSQISNLRTSLYRAQESERKAAEEVRKAQEAERARIAANLKWHPVEQRGGRLASFNGTSIPEWVKSYRNNDGNLQFSADSPDEGKEPRTMEDYGQLITSSIALKTERQKNWENRYLTGWAPEQKKKNDLWLKERLKTLNGENVWAIHRVKLALQQEKETRDSAVDSIVKIVEQDSLSRAKALKAELEKGKTYLSRTGTLESDYVSGLATEPSRKADGLIKEEWKKHSSTFEEFPDSAELYELETLKKWPHVIANPRDCKNLEMVLHDDGTAVARDENKKELAKIEGLTSFACVGDAWIIVASVVDWKGDPDAKKYTDVALLVKKNAVLQSYGTSADGKMVKVAVNPKETGFLLWSSLKATPTAVSTLIEISAETGESKPLEVKAIPKNREFFE